MWPRTPLHAQEISVSQNEFMMLNFLSFAAIFYPFFQPSQLQSQGTKAMFMVTMIMASIVSVVYFFAAIFLRRKYLQQEKEKKKRDFEMTIRAAIADEQNLPERQAVRNDAEEFVQLRESQNGLVTALPTMVVPPPKAPADVPSSADAMISSRMENLESKFGDLVDQLRLIAQQQLELSQLGREQQSQSSGASSLSNSAIAGEAGRQPKDLNQSVHDDKKLEEPPPNNADEVVQFPVGSTSYFM